MKQYGWSSFGSYLILFAVLLLCPLVMERFMGNMGNYILLIAFNVIMYAAMGSAWNIIGGFARQISWAHASFFAIGAYSAMIPLVRWEISPFFGMLVGVVIAVAAAFAIGFPAFRLKGVFFSLCTLACGQIVYRLLLHSTGFTGGASGLVMRRIEADAPGMLLFTNPDIYYYLMLALAGLIVAICITIEKSRFGYYLKAIREDEVAAESLGMNTNRIKLWAFMLSAALMALIGVIYALRFKYLDPESVSSHDLAIRIGMTVIVGGIGTVWGPIIGAIITVPLLELTNAYFGNMLNGGLSQLLYGLILVLMVIFMPEGVISIRRLMGNTTAKGERG